MWRASTPTRAARQAREGSLVTQSALTPVEVRGRSAPHVPLNVDAQATNALRGLIGINQNVFSNTVTTDERGHFAFRFEPPSVTMPGTRYEVNNAGNVAGQEKSMQLTLVQQ